MEERSIVTVVLPNIRRLFVPDPGFVMLDADLSGADALVVAAESNDPELIDQIRSGYDLHSENAIDMESHPDWLGPKFSTLDKGSSIRHDIRQQFKSAVHGTNYGAAAKTLAATFGWTYSFADSFQSRWFKRHPGVQTWHKKTEGDLFSSRSVRNKFGYRIIYFDRIDSLFSQALAWIPQSTVAEVCFRGALRLEELCPWVEILIQVHDSLVFQIPKEYFHTPRLREIHSALHVPVPYPDPLVIPWKLSASTSSWGECKEIEIK